MELRWFQRVEWAFRCFFAALMGRSIIFNANFDVNKPGELVIAPKQSVLVFAHCSVDKSTPVDGGISIRVADAVTIFPKG
jgi:hypothetical protein